MPIDEKLLTQWIGRQEIQRDMLTSVPLGALAALLDRGPLVATLLMNLLREQLPQAQVTAFTFRAMRPVFDPRPLRLCGRAEGKGSGVHLWAEDAQGFLCMDARAELA